MGSTNVVIADNLAKALSAQIGNAVLVVTSYVECYGIIFVRAQGQLLTIRVADGFIYVGKQKWELVDPASAENDFRSIVELVKAWLMAPVSATH